MPTSCQHRLGSRRCRGILREVIRAVKRSRDARIHLHVAVVGAVNERVLEPAWIVERQVQLAVLGVVRHGGARADVGLEGVEAESHEGLVGAVGGRHCALGAAIA